MMIGHLGDTLIYIENHFLAEFTLSLPSDPFVAEVSSVRKCNERGDELYKNRFIEEQY